MFSPNPLVDKDTSMGDLINTLCGRPVYRKPRTETVKTPAVKQFAKFTIAQGLISGGSVNHVYIDPGIVKSVEGYSSIVGPCTRIEVGMVSSEYNSYNVEGTAEEVMAELNRVAMLNAGL